MTEKIGIKWRKDIFSTNGAETTRHTHTHTHTQMNLETDLTLIKSAQNGS